MPKKKDPKDAGVVSLNDARRRRELDKMVGEIHELTKGLTDTVAQLVDTYHQWEKEHPDLAVAPVDKLEMISFGFVGSAGYKRCHEEHRLPGLALFGVEGDPFALDDELAENVMCPALESGRCRNVLDAFERPPCILLGAELQQAVAPTAFSGLAEDALNGGWRDSEEEEQQRFARARKLVKKYEKIEAASEKSSLKPRRE